MKLFERFCEAFNIEFGDTDELAELVEFTPPPGGSGLSTPVARTAAENTIEQLEAHIDHLGETLTEVRRERDELHRMTIERRNGETRREIIKRAGMATEVAEVLRSAGPLDMGATLAGRVAQVIEQRDLARSEARRYAARLGKL